MAVYQVAELIKQLTMMTTRRRVLPGFRISLGFTTVYLLLMIGVPLAACAWKALSLSPREFLAAALTDRAIAAYRVTFFSALYAGFISVVIGTLIAWVLVRYRFPGHRVFDALVDIPFALPTAVAGLVFSTLYAPNGWLGQFLVPLGIELAYTRGAIVLVMVFIGFPFVVRTLQPILASLDTELEDAAILLGANRWQTFYRVILPPILPGMVAGFAMAFARALGEYGSIVFVSSNIPGRSEIAALLVVNKLEEFKYTEATAVAIVMLAASLLMLIAVGLIERATRRWDPLR
jgi:sulfate/thiosulfate transport system permease protein